MRILSIIQIIAIVGGSSTGCGPSAMQLRERDPCYEHAEAAAQARVDAECPAPDAFASCASADAILDELRQAREACP